MSHHVTSSHSWVSSLYSDSFHPNSCSWLRIASHPPIILFFSISISVSRILSIDLSFLFPKSVLGMLIDCLFFIPCLKMFWRNTARHCIYRGSHIHCSIFVEVHTFCPLAHSPLSTSHFSFSLYITEIWNLLWVVSSHSFFSFVSNNSEAKRTIRWSFLHKIE